MKRKTYLNKYFTSTGKIITNDTIGVFEYFAKNSEYEKPQKSKVINMSKRLDQVISSIKYV